MSTKKEKACAEYCFSQPEEYQFSIGEDLAEAFDAGWDAAEKNTKQEMIEKACDAFCGVCGCQKCNETKRCAEYKEFKLLINK